MTHDVIHAETQSDKNASLQPKLRNILIKEIMPLIKQERKNGTTQPANFVGSLGILPIIFGRSLLIFNPQNVVFIDYATL